MTRRVRLRKPVFMNIRVTEEQAHFIKNQRFQNNEPIDSAMQRIIEKCIRYEKEHPGELTKTSLHAIDDRMSSLLLGAESSDVEITYDWMRSIRKYEKELNLDGDNPYEIIKNLRVALDREHQKLVGL